MAEYQIPSFLAGLFDWRSNGFYVSPDAANLLLQQEMLNSENPWIVMAAVAERAKRGDRSGIPMLAGLCEDRESFALARTALFLIGDMGRDEELALLQSAMASDDAEIRMNACSAAALSGRLWLVPSMLDAWSRAEARHDHEIIGYRIADLLEPEGGALSETAGTYATKRPLDARLAAAWDRYAQTWREEDIEFPGLVNQAYSRLTALHGTNRVTVWHGELFSVEALARTLLEIAARRDAVSLFDYRHRLEANTGIDCRRFFHGNERNFPTIVSTVEELLDSGKVEGYEAGARYFFGHRID